MTTGERKTNQGIHTISPFYGYHDLTLAGKIVRTTVMSILIMVMFITGTNYNKRYDEEHSIEDQIILPEFTVHLKESLKQADDTFHIEIEGERLHMERLTGRFYFLRDFHPAFTTYNDLNEEGVMLLGMIENARFYGLEPEHYHTGIISSLQQKLQKPDLKKEYMQIRKDIELLLTDAALKFMMHLHSGYRSIDSCLFSDPYIMSLPETLAAALSGSNFRESILSCQPDFIEYVRLRQATEKFIQRVELSDNWVEVYELKKDSVSLWNGIGEVLERLGYMVNDTGYVSLCNALKSFQRYHGLEPDGIPGNNTLEALSQSTLYRFRILALNLDRLRKQQQPASQLIFINIPSYNLKVIKENKIENVYQVCVGTTYSPTPRIDGSIQQIVINPEWNVPKRIARNEILPRIKSDADYLKRNNFKVLDENMNAVNYEEIDWDAVSSDEFNYYIRQNPGSGNALGEVKLVFENPYSVYLHDTPSKSLFSKDIRAFSHGCVRVQNLDELADYLVQQLQPEYTDIKELIHRGITHKIDLINTIPLQIRYITCEGDERGDLYYYKDIYGLDKKEIEDFLKLVSV
ncbi:MAG: L,D-transpeptidase family protein [Bacteroidales bacterium]|nr:L,D-transpeptidase family protein [Bacteroidales bacterium]